MGWRLPLLVTIEQLLVGSICFWTWLSCKISPTVFLKIHAAESCEISHISTARYVEKNIKDFKLLFQAVTDRSCNSTYFKHLHKYSCFQVKLSECHTSIISNEKFLIVFFYLYSFALIVYNIFFIICLSCQLWTK